MRPKNASLIFETLLSATSLSGFLRTIVALSPNAPGGKGAFSYAELSRRAGFASRNYVREIALGNRRLSAKSLTGLTRAFGLKGDTAKYFALLARLDNPGIDDEAMSTQQITMTMSHLREKLQNRRERRISEETSIYAIPDWPDLYAALGRANGGATLGEITCRTRFSAVHCQQTLTAMEKHGVVRYDSDRYFPGEGHLIFSESIATGLFQKYFQQGLKNLASESRERFVGDDRLFFRSSFSVSAARMQEFKKELRELLLKFSEDCETAEGDKIATLLCGLV